MRKGRIVNAFICLALVMVVLFSPFSLNINQVKENDLHAEETFKRNLSFFAENDASKILSSVKKEDKEGLAVANDKFEKNQLNVQTYDLSQTSSKSVSDATDVAYPIHKVKQDLKLKEKLKNQLSRGKKIYLYGDVSFKDYKSLLNLDEISTLTIGENGKKHKLTYGDEEAIAEKEGKKLKENPNSLARKGEDTYDIIGYTLDNSSKSKLTVRNISVYNENGEKVEPSLEHYFKEILDDVSRTIKIDEENNDSSSEDSVSVIDLNIALADNTVVKSSNGRIYGTAYYDTTAVGRTITEWVLEQNTTETDSDYDYFVVHDKTTIDAYSGWRAYKLKTDHDIPYSTDYIWDWDPDDDSSSPYAISFGYPYNISFNFAFSDDADVNNIGSQTYDYGRWLVTDYELDGERFEPNTAWRSSGTYASMDIREYGYFKTESRGFEADSYVKIDVNYNY